MDPHLVRSHIGRLPVYSIMPEAPFTAIATAPVYAEAAPKSH